MLRNVPSGSFMGSEPSLLNTGLNFSALILPSIKNEYCIYKPFINLCVIQQQTCRATCHKNLCKILGLKKKEKNTFNMEDVASKREGRKNCASNII